MSVARLRPLFLTASMVLLAALMAMAPPPDDASAQDADADVGRVPIERLAGAGRIATAVAISAASFDSAETVYLARADQYADALAGGPLAAQDDAPVLLSGSDSLPTEVAAEIGRLGATRAVLLGGQAAITDAVAQALQNSGLAVERLSGDNRFATAAAIAGRMPDSSTVYIAEGANADPNRGFPDALAVGPLAAAGGNPILLAVNGEVPADTVTTLQALAPDEIVVLGGTAALGDAVQTTLETLAPDTRRIAGANRFETSALLYDESVAAGLSIRGRWLATGLSFPDALAAGPAIARAGQTLLLVDGTNLAASDPVNERLAADYCALERIVLLGGEAAISRDASTQLASVLPTDTDCPNAIGSLSGPSGIPACPSGGFDTADLADLVASLDPELDPDGDGFTTGEEINNLGFNPLEPLRFNPLVADIPQVDLEFNGALELVAEGEFIEGYTDSITEIASDEVTDTRTNDETYTTETNLSVSAKVVVEANISASPSFGVTATGTFETGYSRGSSLSLQLTREAKTMRTQSLETARTQTANQTGASLLLDVTVVNNSDVGVRLTDASLLPFLYLNRGENQQSLGAERNAYALPVMEAAAITGSQDLAPTIGPNQSADLRFQTGEDLSLDQYHAFLDDFGGLEFRLQGLQLESIGDVDIRNDGADFAQFLTTIRNNTVPIVIDADPEGGPRTHYVSTTFERDAQGFGVGVTLCQALDLILGFNLITVTEELEVGDFTGDVTYVETLGLPEGTFGTDADSAWALATTGAEQGAPIDVDGVVLGPSDGVRLIHIVDADDDTLSELDEVRLYGTSDEEADSDGDGASDLEEATSPPWTVQVLDSEGTEIQSYEVRSDPAVADIDADSVQDPDERENLTDPFRADTDGDGTDDGEDESPLGQAPGTGTGGTIPQPVHHWSLSNIELPASDPMEDSTVVVPDIGTGGRDLQMCLSEFDLFGFGDDIEGNFDLGVIPAGPVADGSESIEETPMGYAFGLVQPEVPSTRVDCGFLRTFLDASNPSPRLDIWDDPFQLSMWVRLPDGSPRTILFGDGRPGHFNVTWDSDNGITNSGELAVGAFDLPDNGGGTYRGTAAVRAGTQTFPISTDAGWQHLHLISLGESAVLYINGTSVGTIDHGVAPTNAGANANDPIVFGMGHFGQPGNLDDGGQSYVEGYQPWVWGARDRYFYNFGGRSGGTGMDDVRIYAYAGGGGGAALAGAVRLNCAIRAAGPNGSIDATYPDCTGAG